MIPAGPPDRRDEATGASGGRAPGAAADAWSTATIGAALVASIGATVAVTGGPTLLLARAAVLALLALAIAAVLGTLVVVVLVLQTDDRRRGGLLDLAAAGAGVWAVAAAVTAFLLYLGEAPPISSTAFGPGLVSFVSDVAIGRTWLIAAIAAAVLSTLLVAVRSSAGVAVLGVLTVVAIVPVALQSPAPGEPIAAARTVAAAGLVQLVAIASWIGALAVTGALRTTLRRALPACGFAALVIATASAWPALTSDGADSPMATAGAVAIALAGVLTLLPGSSRRTPAFHGAQLVLLAVGAGLGAAASVTRGVPEVRTATTPAEILTGAPLPPPASIGRLLGGWQGDPLWLVAAGALLAGYGVVAIRTRGWPPLRSMSWILGVLALVWLTSGGPAEYQELLLEAHLLQHLGLLLAVPLLLAGGAPIRLLSSAPSDQVLRAGSLRFVGSPGVRLLARPVPAAVLAVAAVLGLYGTGALRWSVTDAVGAEASTVTCLLVGAVLVHALTAPTARRRGTVMVAVALLVLESAGAAALALGSSLLLADWFGALGWGTDALAAQRGGAGPAWAVAAVPTLLLLLRGLRSPGTARASVDRPEAVVA
jgi:putative copper resistance protein D